MRHKLPFVSIPAVTFQPWIGPWYRRRSPRLLIVGMSHYMWDRNRLPLYFVTNQVLMDRISGKVKGKVFTNIAATCLGHKPSVAEWVQFWNSVAFYNYIQEFVGDGPRKKHPYRLWERSHNAFGAVIKRLAPQLVMFVGRANWGNSALLEGWEGEQLRAAPDPKYSETWWYPLSTARKALGFHIKHTSAGYNFRAFAPLFREAEALVMRLRAPRGHVD